MGFNKKFFTTGGIVASTPPAAAAAFDPLQNFETVTYTGNGSTQKITGYIRKGAAFNGSSSYIALPITTNYSNLSISCWVNLSSIPASGDATLISKGYYNSSSDTEYIHLRYEGSTNQFKFAVRKNSTYNQQAASGITASANTWYHVVGTLDSSGNAQIYVNGTAGTGITSAPTMTNSDDFEIGSFVTTSALLNGKIDQVRIFNKALSSGEVTTLYGETYASSTKSTTDIFNDGSGVALYELDEDANDSSGTSLTSTHYVFIADAGGKLTDVRINTISSEFTYSAPSGYSDFGGALQTSNGYNESLWNITESNKRATKNDSYYHSGLITQNSYSSGKYYLELEFLAADLTFGVTKQSDLTQLYLTEAVENMIRFANYSTSVFAYSALNTSSDGQVLSTNDVIGLAIDYDNAELHYYVNNTLVTTQNLASSNYNGTPTNVNFLGMAFQPDLVWIKNRTATVESHMLYDSIRTATEAISSNTTAAETTRLAGLTSFDSNGFTVGSGNAHNQSGASLVAWCWKAADTTTTIAANTVGNTIASDVRANQAAGFSIVKYTGNSSSNQTIGHGLSSAPELIIIKNLDDGTANWLVAGENINYYLNLNRTEADPSSSSYNWITNRGATTFTVGSQRKEQNINNQDFIAYCFHSVDSYQKVGSYEGNGTSKDIVTGFEPRFLLMKNADNGTGNWVIFDSIRGVNQRLFPDLSNAENTITTQLTSFNSDGFSVGSNTNVNGLNNTIIYLAIA